MYNFFYHHLHTGIDVKYLEKQLNELPPDSKVLSGAPQKIILKNSTPQIIRCVKIPSELRDRIFWVRRGERKYFTPCISLLDAKKNGLIKKTKNLIIHLTFSKKKNTFIIGTVYVSDKKRKIGIPLPECLYRKDQAKAREASIKYWNNHALIYEHDAKSITTTPPKWWKQEAPL